MEVVHPRCAGIDVSKKDAKVCVRIQGRGRNGTKAAVTTWGAMSGQILALREHLLAEKVTCVVMEATSDYWKPFYYLLEDELNVMLVNAHAVRNMPGRKSDVSDAAWLADLGAHGLVRASFVPPPPIRQLRDLTRARTVITRERSREAQRLEKLLEDAGIKLTTVVSNITGVSSRAMLEALIEGQDEPAAIAELVHWRMRPKIPALVEALTGRFGDHHRFMTRLYLDRIDAHNADIARLDARIEAAMEPFLVTQELLMSIPGISRIVAEVFIAETGGDMSVFPAAHHLASWCGVCPGSNESAGKVKSTSTRPGDRYLKARWGSPRRRWSSARKRTSGPNSSGSPPIHGPMRALVAIEHAMIVAAWHMLTNGAFYCEPGKDYYLRRAPARSKARAVQLESLGYKVTLESLADTA